MYFPWECLFVNDMKINSIQPSFKKMIDWSYMLHIGQKQLLDNGYFAFVFISFRLNEK